MKSTGIVRKVDELGRIVIPAELRRTMKIDIADPVEIFVDEGSIILRKYEPDSLMLSDLQKSSSVKSSSSARTVRIAHGNDGSNIPYQFYHAAV